MAGITVSAALLQRQLAAIFTAWGFDRDHIGDIVELMVESDLRGIDSHGVGKIKLYERHFREGRNNQAPEIRLVRDLPESALIAGDNGIGHRSSNFSMETAIAYAGRVGARAVSVTNSSLTGNRGVSPYPE